MDMLSALLVFLALAAGFIGLVFSSQATAGVAIVAVGCLLAIFARMAQASHHHRARAIQPTAAPTPDVNRDVPEQLPDRQRQVLRSLP